MKKNWIILLVVIVCLIGVICGITFYKKQVNNDSENKIKENVINEISEKIEDECTVEGEVAEKVEEANSSEERISPNSFITLKKHYKKCNHIINEYIEVPEKLVNMTEEELKEEYKDWEIKNFSNTQITLYKEFEGECGEHFWLIEDDGKIFIYSINEDGTKMLYEETEISTDYLTEEDRNEIKKGIRVNGKEELNQVIENFE